MSILELIVMKFYALSLPTIFLNNFKYANYGLLYRKSSLL
jgi:hypothetical protein